MQALQEAYKNEIMIGRFPACVLELTLPYASVDVNVHPAKTEIKFLQDSSVYECIYFGVKSALSAADELTTPLEKKPLPTHPPISTGVQQTLKSPKATTASRDETASKPASFPQASAPENTPAARRYCGRKGGSALHRGLALSFSLFGFQIKIKAAV